MLDDSRSPVFAGVSLRRHLPVLVLVTFMFLMGVIFGSLSVRALPGSQKAELAEDLMVFFRGFGGSGQNEAGAGAAPRQALYNNVKTILLAFLLGLSVIGAPGVLVLLFLRGFVIGFTVGFLVDEMAAKGVVLAAASVLPQNIFIIPAILAGCEASLAFAVTLALDRLSHKRVPIYPQLFFTAVVCLGAVVLLVAGSAVETYVAPTFIRLVSRYLL
ncbi:MAG: stage II sporulation protein M [Firmicutes bacterium]|jgi:stage II sporulation protein M|nr:stage II sporulation protein M [Bacillota bacterium]MDH7495527.1 stage II sporulation protein M [Bacillota bacterium]